MTSTADRENSTDIERIATQDEVKAAIESLEPADHAKLLLIARSFCRKRLLGGIHEDTDLCHDAIVATLEGKRRWNKTVSIIRHLDRVMESKSSHIAETRQHLKLVPMPEAEKEPRITKPNVRDELSIRSELQNVFLLFESDSIALKLLRLKGDGYTASEIQRELHINPTQYETVTRRIRRHIIKDLTQ